MPETLVITRIGPTTWDIHEKGGEKIGTLTAVDGGYAVEPYSGPTMVPSILYGMSAGPYPTLQEAALALEGHTGATCEAGD